MRKRCYAVVLYVAILACGVLGNTHCWAARTAEVRVASFGVTREIEVYRRYKPPIIPWGSHLSVGTGDTIELEPGTRLSVGLRKGYDENVKVTWRIDKAEEKTCCLTPTKRKADLCQVPEKGTVILKFEHCGDKDVNDRVLTIKPANSRDYTPVVSYVFAPKAKACVGMAQPIAQIGTFLNQPLLIATVMGVSADDQPSFLGSGLMMRLYSSSRYDEQPSSGVPLQLTLAAGVRGFKFGEGNLRNELFLAVSLSLFQRPAK